MGDPRAAESSGAELKAQAALKQKQALRTGVLISIIPCDLEPSFCLRWTLSLTRF